MILSQHFKERSATSTPPYSPPPHRGSGSSNDQFPWLSGGKQLGLTQSQSDLQTSMSNNLKAFFIANFIHAAEWIVEDHADTILA
jgi:hypothetical protein